MTNRANRPSGESSLAKFKKLRADVTMDNKECASAIMALPVFCEKFGLVRTRFETSWCNIDGFEDAMQNAAMSVYCYLTNTRGSAFVGESDDELGAWLYCLLRQHCRWASTNYWRARRRRQYHEWSASLQLVLTVRPCNDFERREWLTAALLLLAGIHRRVLAAWLRGEDVEMTMRRLGISRRTYFRLRKEAIGRLREQLRDEDDDSSSLVPV